MSVGRARAPIPCCPFQTSHPYAVSWIRSEICSRAIQSVHTTPAKTAEIMQRRGWVLEKGIWTKEGTPFKITIDLHPNLHDIVPVLVEQLRRAGFDAGFRMTSDYYTRMTVGDARAFLIGNAGSVRDPYFTLRLYHSRYVQPTGTAAIYFWRWQNDHFDQIIDRMAGTAPDDPQLLEHFRQAMEIWLRELPSIPLLQWYLQNSPQRNLLAELAHRGDALYQQRLLGAHMAAGPPRA